MLRKSATDTSLNRNQDLKDLPLLSEESRKQLLDPETHRIRIGYLYDPERGLRHMNARVFLQALYYVGAVLINKGMAYSGDHRVMALTQGHGGADDLTEDGDINKERRQKLLAYYHNLTPYQNSRCSTISKNPFHALFVLKVALDHLPATVMMEALEKLMSNEKGMTFMPFTTAFPDGSSFVDDHAAASVLGKYIQLNPQKFRQFKDRPGMALLAQVTPDDLSRFLSAYPVLGGNPEEAAINTMRDLLAMDVRKEVCPSLSGSTIVKKPEAMNLTLAPRQDSFLERFKFSSRARTLVGEADAGMEKPTNYHKM